MKVAGLKAALDCFDDEQEVYVWSISFGDAMPVYSIEDQDDGTVLIEGEF